MNNKTTQCLRIWNVWVTDISVNLVKVSDGHQSLRSQANRSLCRLSDRRGDCVAHRSAATSESLWDWCPDVCALCFRSDTYLTRRWVGRRKSLSSYCKKNCLCLSNDSNPRSARLFGLQGRGRKPDDPHRQHEPDFSGKPEDRQVIILFDW